MGIARLLDDFAKKLYNAGKVKSLYDGLNNSDRLRALNNDYSDAAVLLGFNGILPKQLYDLFVDQKILDVVSQLGLGDSISLHPAWNLRTKVRSHQESTVPWHQDNSYFEPRTWDEMGYTVWVPLIDTHVKNGCMQMVKGSHKSGVTSKHTLGSTTSTWFTETNDEAIAKQLLHKKSGIIDYEKDVVTCECKAGSALIFPMTTVHRSLASESDIVRWSVDFRHTNVQSKRPGKSSNDWFFGVKDSLPIREGNKMIEPDWMTWGNADRNVGQGQKHTELDATCFGPWMDTWDIDENIDGHFNRHLTKYLRTLDQN